MRSLSPFPLKHMDDSNSPSRDKPKGELVDEKDLWDLDLDDAEEPFAESPEATQPSVSRSKANVPRQTRSQVKVIGSHTAPREIPSLPNRSQEGSQKSTTVKVLGAGLQQGGDPFVSKTDPSSSKVDDPVDPFGELEPDEPIASQPVPPAASEPEPIVFEETPEPVTEAKPPAPIREEPPAAKNDQVPVSQAPVETVPLEPTPISKEPKRERIKFSGLEKVALILLGLLVIGGFAASATSLISPVLPFTPNEWQPTALPIKGESVTLQSVETAWFPSERSSTDEALEFLPLARITSSPDTPSSTVRVFVENSDGEIIGDPTNLVLEPGKAVTYKGSKGFEDSGALAAYRERILDPYYLVVMETSPGSSGAKRFAQILMAPTEEPAN